MSALQQQTIGADSTRVRAVGEPDKTVIQQRTIGPDSTRVRAVGPNLTILHGFKQRLSGQIPVELSKLTSLEELELEGNPGLYAPSDAEFRAWLANLKKFSIDNLDQIDDSDRYEELSAKFREDCRRSLTRSQLLQRSQTI